MDNLMRALRKTKQASRTMASLSHKTRKAVLLDFARSILKHRQDVLFANKKDLTSLSTGNNQAFRERLELDAEKISGIISGIRQVVSLPDPLGEVLQTITRPNGLVIRKVSVPLGVVGVIYESRPNVTVDLASLAIKTGNALVLKGGKESFRTNKVLIALLRKILKKRKLPAASINLIDPAIRWQKPLLNAYGQVDVLIPRGGNHLINFVRQHAHIPVIETGAGVCHTFVDEKYSFPKAVAIIINAKTQRPSVCNSLDTLVAHKKILKPLLLSLSSRLARHRVEIRADADSWRVLNGEYPSDLLKKANRGDFGKEFLGLVMSVKSVGSFSQGLDFIKAHTSGHSEAILTENINHANQFLNEVDAAVIYHNASTRFTDGGEFGLGAEVGIATQKLHARGPMGLGALTSYKWIVYGKGQVRA